MKYALSSLNPRTLKHTIKKSYRPLRCLNTQSNNEREINVDVLQALRNESDIGGAASEVR